MNNTRQSAPTIFIIFGVTGDLAQNKLLPALFNLYCLKLLPEKFEIVGFGRRDWTDLDFKRFVDETLIKRVRDFDQDFLKRLSYVRGQFDDPKSYHTVSNKLEEIDSEWGICSNKMFYLAVPPVNYKVIVTELHRSGLSKPCGGDLGWTRLLIEKPFGNDLVTARSLNLLLKKLFKEEQIFRIDHYLAKESIQNILAFRRANPVFDPLWSGKFIERVKLQLFEEKPVGKRGAFYDNVGALRDVGQNHLLQMLALVLMDLPKTIDTKSVRKARASVIANLNKITQNDAHKKIIRGQHEDYHKGEGVDENSQTETYFRIHAGIKTKKWKGTEIILESGKSFEESFVSIEIDFKPLKEGQKTNTLKFIIQPEQEVSFCFWVKKANSNDEFDEKKMAFSFETDDSRRIDAYEKILIDCIRGDQMIFTTTEEVENAWRWIMNILENWKSVPLQRYPHKAPHSYFY